MDRWVFPEYTNLDSKLQNALLEIFALPHVSERTDLQPNDLAIDVAIPEYRTGYWGYLAIEDSYPFWWRPRLAVKSRIFEIESNKAISEFTVVQKMRWMHFFRRAFHVRVFIRLSPFYPEDFEYMLMEACVKLLDKMRKSI